MILVGETGGRWVAARASTRRPSRRDQRVAVAARRRWRTRRGESFEIPLRSRSRLYLNVVDQTSKLALWVTPRQSATFPNVSRRGPDVRVSSTACECCGPITSDSRGASTCRRRSPRHGVRHCTGTWALGYDRAMTPETPGSHWSEGLPDFDASYEMSDIRPGWEPGTKRRGRRPDATRRTRSVRHRDTPCVARSPTGSELGYRPFVGMEFEAYVFEPDGNGGWRPLDTPGAYVYGTGPSVDPHGLLDAIWEACGEAEIPLESVNSEYDTPQFEFTLRYSDALRAADDGFLFKVLAREVAHRQGLLLTFMGKPPVGPRRVRDSTSTSRFATTPTRT